ncbi:LysR family transcriptional regulator [Roseibium sp. HPY-6]|uniref:LysR family transcriptional regulator n=1 Tax=Roseibium sp. HPY-6 TaxID=3229852 RepID=UPI00338F74BD
MRINFDFNDLEAFLAVMETVSFHHAAERLNLSQSAVTRRIQKLEETLGSVLFDRTTRAVKPTLAAKRLQARAEAMLESARETTLAMRDESVAFAHQRGAVVTVAMIPTLVHPLLIPALQMLHDKGLPVRLRLLDQAANEVAEAVSREDADFGVCSIGLLEPNTHFEPLFDDLIVLCLPQGHHLATKSKVTWADIQSESLILPARGTGNRLLIDEAMARSRFTPQWAFEVGRSTTAMELVNEGLGVALLPRTSMLSSQGRGLVYKALGAPVVARPVGLLTRISAPDTSLAQAFKSALRETSAALRAS